MITINNEECDSKVRRIGKEVKKYNRRLEKDFGKWREEERVICSEIDPSSGKNSSNDDHKPKRIHLSKITFHDEYEFPINPVVCDIRIWVCSY